MKRIFILMLSTILSIVLLSACTSLEKKEINMIKFESGTYFIKIGMILLEPIRTQWFRIKTLLLKLRKRFSRGWIKAMRRRHLYRNLYSMMRKMEYGSCFLGKHLTVLQLAGIAI